MLLIPEGAEVGDVVRKLVFRGTREDPVVELDEIVGLVNATSIAD
jgi:hypothetical protein